MKTSLLAILISLTASTGFCESEIILKKYYGDIISDINEVTLQSHHKIFCETAPGLISKRFGMVVVSNFSCKAGIPQVRIKDGQRYFLVTKVQSYYGERELDLVTTLTKKNGTDIFGTVGVLGLDGE